MSIYASMWEVQVPLTPWPEDNRWVTIYAQGVPPHIGHPKCGYEKDPYADFLPPVVMDYDPTIMDEDYNPPYRAVVVLQQGKDKKEGQRYVSPLFVLNGEEHMKIGWCEMLGRITEAIRRK